MRFALLAAVCASTGVAAVPSGSAEATPPAAAGSTTRFVGAGQVAVAVPIGWGTNRVRSGTPDEDTVLINEGGVTAACARTPYPLGVETVRIWRGKPDDSKTADRVVKVDGIDAERHDTTCRLLGQVSMCQGTVYFRSHNVSVQAESSTDPAETDRGLGWIRIPPAMVGVPSYQDLDDRLDGRAKQAYVNTLRRDGLKARVLTTRVSHRPPGYVLAVDPYPGTMLRIGTRVTVLVAASPGLQPQP